MTNSRQKGKRGELEVVHLLQQHGYEARRGQQFKGTADSPDVIHNLPGFFIEVKLRQQLNLHAAIEKAQQETAEAAGLDYPKETPIVFHRKNGKPWLVTMTAEDFFEKIPNDNDT